MSNQSIIRYGSITFTSLSHAIAVLNDIEDPVTRYAAQQEVADQLATIQQTLGNQLEDFLAYVVANQAWAGFMTREQFQTQWAPFQQIADQAKTGRDLLGEAKRKIREKWGNQPNLDGKSYHYLSNLRRLALRMSYSEALVRIGRAVADRVTHPAPRRTGSLDPTIDDLARAASDSLPQMPPDHILSRHRITIAANGLVIPAVQGRIIGEVPSTPGSSSTRPSTPPRRATPPVTVGQPSPYLSSPRHPTPPSAPTHRRTRSGSVVMEDLSRPSSPSPLALVAEESDSELSEAPSNPVYPEEQSARNRCTCSASVSKSWKKLAESSKPLPPFQCASFIARWYETPGICHFHARGAAGSLGMTTNHSAQVLRQRLAHIYQNRDRFGDVRAAVETYRWFCTSERPARTTDQLGPYRFFHADAQEYRAPVDRLLADDFTQAELDTWNADGNIVRSLFKWWFDQKISIPGCSESCIGEVALAEYDMYRHHQRDIMGRTSYGWLRTMVHSLAQQAMRQDPQYYRMYVALRPDRAWRLVSYPYYTKYAVPGDSTYFRHVDQNIGQLLATGRGSDMIQGSLSLDDEVVGNCTTFLPGMHRRLREWWSRVTARGLAADDFVIKISDDMWTKEDSRDFNSVWTDVVCKRGDVRITMPSCPHGSHGPCKAVRRTMLPWFVRVADDHETLENAESGTWSELSAAHRDLVAAARSPSGFASHYGVIPYRFPAAVELTGLGPLSDALVCRRKWTSPAVLEERDRVLGPKEESRRAIAAWRVNTIRQVIIAFQSVKKAEMQAFGTRSYFRHRASQPTGLLPLLPEDEGTAVPASD